MPFYRLILLVCVFGTTAFCAGQVVENSSKDTFTADILKTTLFARTDADKAFCDYVIKKRDDGTLPKRILYGVYDKAVQKEQEKRFYYFQKGLETVCKKEKIQLGEIPAEKASKRNALPKPMTSLVNFFRRTGS